MKTTLQLDKHYDVDRLVHDTELAHRRAKAHVHFGPYHDGGWKAIALVSPGGRMDAEGLKFAKEEFKKTPLLEECSYFNEIVDYFKCPVKRVRLLRLEPGANIFTHNDPGDAWALGEVRLHIPIITSDQVYFYIDEERVIMRPGELWYCDFSRFHRLANKGTEARIHLVLDLTVNEWLRAHFPEESLGEKLYNAKYWTRYHASETAYKLGRALGLGRIKRMLRA